MKFLRKAQIPDSHKVYADYPHQLSGGMKQRAMIAMALANSPQLLILDEPTTALDVTTQAQILELLEEIIKRENLSVLFISHDFGIIAKMCDRVAVMNKGKIVEFGDTKMVIGRPKDPYTIALLESVKALA
ncbi:MAG: ATP-binding cassette domain-containing protein [Candidatus Omnitrophica bacterium]|nr:ATP-binding cassette domain-containing protein [Candidatus Omnitrophota bacterium]